MKPIETERTNFTYELPGGTEANNLPCRRHPNGKVESTWDFETDAEREWVIEERRFPVVIWWPNQVGFTVRFGDHGHEYDADGVEHPERGVTDGRTWLVYRFELNDDDVEALKDEDEGTVTLTVDMMPPPPVALGPALFAEAE